MKCKKMETGQSKSLWSFLSSESCEQVPIQSNNGDARKETPSPLPYEEESNYLPIF